MPGHSTEQDGEFTAERADESKVSGRASTAGRTDLVPCAAPHSLRFQTWEKKRWDSLSTIFTPDKVRLMERAVSTQLTEIKAGCPSTVITT